MSGAKSPQSFLTRENSYDGVFIQNTLFIAPRNPFSLPESEVASANGFGSTPLGQSCEPNAHEFPGKTNLPTVTDL